MELTIRPATADRWDDVAAVFGERGDPARCWCTYLFAAKYDMTRRADNRAALRAAVRADRRPGLLAYRDGTPVGWAAAGPRDGYSDRLSRSPVLRPLPFDGEVWSVLCFVVPPPFRGQGVASALLAGAVDAARAGGAAAVEGVPRDDTSGRRWSDAMAYTGTASMFVKAGFTEVARRMDRPVYRLELRSGSGRNGG